jgi:hypothetical protein
LICVVTIRGSTSDDQFKGFMLVAKSNNNQRIIGRWSITDSSMKTVSCGGAENSAVCHSSANDKTHVEALWHAPSSVSEENTIIKYDNRHASMKLNSIRLNSCLEQPLSSLMAKFMLTVSV